MSHTTRGTVGNWHLCVVIQENHSVREDLNPPPFPADLTDELGRDENEEEGKDWRMKKVKMVLDGDHMSLQNWG